MNQLPNYRKKDVEETPADTYNNRGVDFCAQGDFDEGIAEFSKALRENPNFPLAYFNRGIAFAYLRLEKACVADFETVKLLMLEFTSRIDLDDLDDTIDTIEKHFGISTA